MRLIHKGFYKQLGGAVCWIFGCIFLFTGPSCAIAEAPESIPEQVNACIVNEYRVSSFDAVFKVFLTGEKVERLPASVREEIGRGVCVKVSWKNYQHWQIMIERLGSGECIRSINCSWMGIHTGKGFWRKKYLMAWNDANRKEQCLFSEEAWPVYVCLNAHLFPLTDGQRRNILFLKSDIYVEKEKRDGYALFAYAPPVLFDLHHSNTQIFTEEEKNTAIQSFPRSIRIAVDTKHSCLLHKTPLTIDAWEKADEKIQQPQAFQDKLHSLQWSNPIRVSEGIWWPGVCEIGDSPDGPYCLRSEIDVSSISVNVEEL